VSLLIISTVPSISTLTIRGDIKALRDKAEKDNVPPLERGSSSACRRIRTTAGVHREEKEEVGCARPPVPTGTATAPPVTGDAGADDDLLRQMMGGGDGGAAVETGGGSDDDLLKAD